MTLSSEPWKRKTNYPYTSDWFIIDEGVRALERWTCLRFVEHTNERDYVGNAFTFFFKAWQKWGFERYLLF